MPGFKRAKVAPTGPLRPDDGAREAARKLIETFTENVDPPRWSPLYGSWEQSQEINGASLSDALANLDDDDVVMVRTFGEYGGRMQWYTSVTPTSARAARDTIIPGETNVIVRYVR